MILVGLTGGIGSGKSTVASRLAELGCRVVDADQVAREIVEVGQPALGDLVEAFGEQILTPEGSLDRAALAALAFDDEESRATLNAITHPRIARVIESRIASLSKTAPGDPEPVVVLDHPLLVENGDTGRFDALVVVFTSQDVRLRRLTESRGLDPHDARARMRAQATDDERCAVATYIVENDGGLGQLCARVDEVHASLRALRRAADGGS